MDKKKNYTYQPITSEKIYTEVDDPIGSLASDRSNQVRFLDSEYTIKELSMSIKYLRILWSPERDGIDYNKICNLQFAVCRGKVGHFATNLKSYFKCSQTSERYMYILSFS
jgi:hypothetical protein